MFDIWQVSINPINMTVNINQSGQILSIKKTGEHISSIKLFAESAFCKIGIKRYTNMLKVIEHIIDNPIR